MGVLYEHWRPDLNECFYVGISWGQEDSRPYDFVRRNPYHQNVINKLNQTGLKVEIRIQAWDLTKEELCELEVLQIAYWRNLIGDRLTNMTLGGEGGISKEINPMKNAEIVAKISGDNHYLNKSPDKLKTLIERMSGENNPAKKPEARKKISDKTKGVPRPYFCGENNPAKSPGVGDKIKNAFANKTQKEKADIIAKREATKASKTPEEKEIIAQKRSKSIKESLSKRGEDEKKEQREKISHTLSLKTEEEKLLKSQRIKNTLAEKSEEERLLKSQRIKNTLAARTEEEKRVSYEKKKIKFLSRTPEMKIEIERKRQESRRKNHKLKLAAFEAAKKLEN